MSSDRFAELKRILAGARELRGDDRARYLARECGADGALRLEIESLLAHDEPESERWDMGQRGAALLGGESALPEFIGPYRVHGLLGEGGMGVVYEAEQESPRRRVALKVLRGGFGAGQHSLILFKREIESLARLEHPGIAAIYDAGHSEAGQHYFTMELVRAPELDEHLSAEGPPRDREALRGRLNLFLKICSVVNFAHRHGVIHRDLKPSNIKVLPGDADAGPDVKILDFGLARLSDAGGEDPSIATEAGQLRGTLPYMSPEQTSGDPAAIDLRSDVYSLGVLLYEMLSGELPYPTRDVMIHEAVRAIRETPPRRPSHAGRLLGGDLETIVLKALEKNPDRRYQSAHALGADIERLLDNQPILARPPSAAYQLRKLIARHKMPFAFLSSLFLVLIVSTVLLSALYAGQTRERRRAESEAAKAAAVNEFLQDMLVAADPGEMGRDVTVRELLDAAARNVDTELRDQPEIRAEVMHTVGYVYTGLGLLDEAREWFEGALAIWEEQHGAGHPDVAKCKVSLAMLRRMDRDYEGAEPLYREALAIYGERFPGDHRDKALALNAVGVLLRLAGRYAEAGDAIGAGLEMRRRLFGERHKEVAASLSELAILRKREGRYQEAEPLFRDALAIVSELYGEENLSVARQLQNLGSLLSRMDRHEEAEALYRRALAVNLALLGDEHPDVASNMSNLGSTLRSLGRYEEADSLLRRALAVNRALHGDSHPQVANTLNNLASLQYQRRQYEEAITLFREVVAMRRELLGEDHPEVALALNNIAVVQKDGGDLAEARTTLEESLAILERALGPDHVRTAVVRYNLGEALYELGLYDEAEEAFLLTLVAYRGAYGSAHYRVSSTLHSLGRIALDRGRPDLALELLRECHDIVRADSSASALRVARVEHSLARCLAGLGEGAEGGPLLLGSTDVIIDSDAPLDSKRRCLDQTIALLPGLGLSAEAPRYGAALDSLNH